VTAKRGGQTIRLTIGSKTAYVDGRTVTLHAPAAIVDDRTCVPLRFVSEALGAAVHWDGTQRIASINIEV